jgi:hypothetical protein
LLVLLTGFLYFLASGFRGDSMNNAFLAAGVAGLLITLSVPAIAQWPSHPTSGVPRTPAGEPDL